MKDRGMTEGTALKCCDQVPHFRVRAVSGQAFEYSTIWQRKNLLLVLLRSSESGDRYLAELSARSDEFRALEAECVVTRDDVAGWRGPGVLIADRWGEIVHLAALSDRASWPGVDELLEWIEHIQHRCPECEGEAK